MTTAQAVAQVDPLTFPLQGSQLIEASAGTGKTWTIAALYVRLILGHGGRPARQPGEILVLTFTDAAAQELRDRIRLRLSQASTVFGLPHTADVAGRDPFLAALRAEWPTEQWPACAQLLELAAQNMDQAAISTIHAWCARVQQEHAFEGGRLFDQELRKDLQLERHEAAWDYWRACVAPLSPPALRDAQKLWAGPRALEDLVGDVADSLPAARPAGDLQSVWEQANARHLAQLAALKAPWVTGAPAYADWLEGLGKQVGIASRDWRRWLKALLDWAQDPTLEVPDLKTGWVRLSPQGLRDAWRGECAMPAQPLAQALADLQPACRQLAGTAPALLEHAMQWLSAHFGQMLQRAAVTGFDGLLTGVASALRSDQGPALAATLRRQYPVALIDEFQDTDPVQYQIFDHVYRVAGNDPDSALILIGDPKQSIYGFRGADVHTYLAAARACAGRVWTLRRNYRSSTAMVDAVNACFSHRMQAVFPTGVAGRSIAFHPAQAQGLAEALIVDGTKPPALTAEWIGPDAAASSRLGQFRDAAAECCAQRIAQLLARGRRGHACFSGAAGDAGVQPRDIAVLVNNRNEAGLVRRALTALGVRSVYLSEQSSVYAAPQALELWYWLAACAHPEDGQAVRTALATPLLGLDVSELAALTGDEGCWDAQMQRFQEYRACWQRRGVLPMLRKLLQDFNVPARLLAAGSEGERQLTDCLHLAELLQAAAAQLDGPQALLRFLQRRCLEPVGDDERRLRLESDETLVKVVTIHKSKGLEYPMVFLPFAACGTARETFAPPRRIVREDGQRVWALQIGPREQEQLAAERLGEEVRKLYVALTRARHAVWLALGAVDHASSTGLGYVLGDDLRQAWDELVRNRPGAVAWETAGADADATALVCDEHTRPSELGPARHMTRAAVGDPWGLSSYSGLLRGAEGRAADLSESLAPETAEQGWLIEGRFAQAGTVGSDELGALLSPLRGLSELPRGAATGTFLHGLLQWAGERGFRSLEGQREIIARRCAVRGWEAHIDDLHAWLVDFIRTSWRPELPGRPALRLDQVAASLTEMEFWLPVQALQASALDVLVSHSIFPGRPRPALFGRRLNGIFKGFVDLVVCIESRYYVIDYKSNDLGPHVADYAPASLTDVMCAERYDVQMVMYVLALHRQLRSRLPDYDYERHMGGAVYFFLRGQAAPGQGLLAWRPSLQVIQALDDLVSDTRRDM